MATFQHQSLDLDLQLLQNLLKQGLGVIKNVWSYETDDWVTSVHAGDIDGDGDFEVVIGSQDGTVQVLTNRGKLKWLYQEEDREWDARVGSIYCVDNVKALDDTRVVVGLRNGQVVSLTEIGKKHWNENYEADQVIRRVCVADIDQDGKAEVLAGSEDFCIHVLNCETGELRWKFPTRGWIRSVFPFDVDGDGEIEVLAASGDKHIYIVDHKGNLKKKYWIGSKVHTLYATDLDADGKVEILFGSDAKDLCIMTPDGTIKKIFDPTNRIHSISAVDLNKDGAYEIVACSEDEHIYILDFQGNLLWKHFLGERLFSLYAVDLNRDGIIEILAGAEDNNVWALAVELQEGLLERIKDVHRRLGSPHSSTLNFSVTERELLHDLVDEPELIDLQMIAMSREKALTIEDPFSALAALLYLKHQYVQTLWELDDLGHVRFVRVDKNLHKPEKELIIGTDEGEVIVLTSKGKRLSSYSVKERIRSLEIGDIDGDGENEVLIGSASGDVYALGLTLLREKLQKQFLDNWIESIAILHPPHTSSLEVVLGTRQTKEIQIYQGDFDKACKCFTIPQGVQSLYTYDINDDGTEEILAGFLDRGVYAYTCEGDYIWQYDTKDRIKAIFVYDIDHDGKVEILVGSEDRNIHVLDNQGNLLWRYDTQHRVLALAILDVDRDGEVKIFVGSGNGQLSVLNSRGDLLWRFQANDRIRSILIEDINKDGLMELVIGTEDRLYMLQLLDQRQLEEEIEKRWQDLLTQQSSEEILQRMMMHHVAHLRAFVLNRQTAGVVPPQLSFLQELREDSSLEVRRALGGAASLFSRIDRAEVRLILDTLASDRRRGVRLILVNCLSEVCQHNPKLGFEYLERLTRSVDLWVRHSVVRQLDHLVPMFPVRVFELLMQMILEDKELWVRQESARVLAHYLDIHTLALLRAMRWLLVKNVDTPLLELIMHCANNFTVKAVFQAFINLTKELSGENVLQQLEQIIAVLSGEARQFKYGILMFQMYQEFYHLHSARSIDEIACYICNPRDWHVPEDVEQTDEEKTERTAFSQTLQVLHHLNTITRTLRVYLRREGLGERISSLLEADQEIEKHSLEMSTIGYPGYTNTFSDYAIMRLLLLRWREIVHAELSLIRGRAELLPELGTHLMVLEETIVIPLSIKNTGLSSAENVIVLLLTLPNEKSFTLVGSNQQSFTTISASKPVQAEFTLKPHTASLRLIFHITYDDSEGKGKICPYGDRLDLVARENRSARLHNPYYTGTAIQDLTMFFGREKEIALLQEDFVHSTAPVVVVLYGQRRSGKSSLIYKLLLSNLLDPHIPARIDMQHITLNFTIEKFFRDVAYSIHREVAKRGYTQAFPNIGLFKDDATFAFDRFLDEVEIWLGRRKLILLIDEFEVLDEQAETHQVDQHLFDHLRSLVQDRCCLNLLLAGTQRLEGLTSAYWSVFFNLASHRRLANLTPEAARQLMIDPMKGLLEFDHFAIEKIRALTGDQPYLIQLFCHALVQHCQTSAKDYITINDVNMVLKEVEQSGRLYFNWIWDQASERERIILAIIAQSSSDGGQLVSLNDIERIFREYHITYTHEELQSSLHNLRAGDVIIEGPNEHRYKIAVDLTRSWLYKNKTLQKVIFAQE